MADTAAEKQEALLQRMAQTIGDTAAKYWIGVAGVITAAGILWGASFALQSSIALQRLNDQQESMRATLAQVQDDVKDIKQRINSRP
jgi:hypothetical protein